MASTIPLLETLEITLSATGVVELAFSRPKRYNALSALSYRVSRKGYIIIIERN